MGVFERLSRIIRSNINDLLDRAENPEKILQQLINDMQQDLREAKIQVASAIREQKRLESQYQENLALAEAWEKRAITAIKDGNDAQAKDAIKRKLSYEQLAKEYKQQYEDQVKSVQFLKSGLAELEAKLSDAKRKKDMLIARQARAKAQKTIAENMIGMSKNSAFSVFERIESKIKDDEAQAQALVEIESEDIEKKFVSLERSDIDAELAKLKAKVEKEKQDQSP